MSIGHFNLPYFCRMTESFNFACDGIDRAYKPHMQYCPCTNDHEQEKHCARCAKQYGMLHVRGIASIENG
jgi:hypothetical protein